MWHSHIGVNLPYGFSCACLQLGLTRPQPRIYVLPPLLSAQVLIWVVSSGPVLGFMLGSLLGGGKKSIDTPVLAWIGVNTRVYLQGSLAPKKMPE